ncbi:MAG: phosphatidylserine decarboxylase family protein [Bacteroidetes bacterium]|nr:phosphatidylserine decarboxylase family protein [Bacteroidota bacterium]
MTIHREGYRIIAVSAFVFVLVNIFSFYFFGNSVAWLAYTLFAITLVLFLLILYFFRIPNRVHTFSESKIVAPADGKVVVIEEIEDAEYFHDNRLQVSIFMSPLNVHVNRVPVDGTVIYNHYHKGEYLVAWHPKSSVLNERHSIVLENANGAILVKQIAGALAKRICNYAHPGKIFKQGEEFGFIKFGSRVDMLLPLDAKVEVQLGQVVKSGVTVIASFKQN